MINLGIPSAFASFGVEAEASHFTSPATQTLSPEPALKSFAIFVAGSTMTFLTADSDSPKLNPKIWKAEHDDKETAMIVNDRNFILSK
jgi:hypothetical protein